MGTLKTPIGRKTLWQGPPFGYFGSIVPYCSPVSGGGGGGLNHYNIEAVLIRRQYGDSSRNTS